MKALITGITGFAGSHLAELLLGENIEVFGAARQRSPMENITPQVKKNVAFIECELRDSVPVKNMLKQVEPDLIFHLAAQSFVPTSWVSPADTITNNIISQLNLFEAMRDLGLKETRIQLACSSEEYGMVHEDEVPIRETNPLRPLSPYAVSKIAQDMMGYQYHESYGIKAIRTRAFNHTGPRRGEIFVTSAFAKQIAMIEKGRQEPVMKVGNLEARRDFTDVRDTVRAYLEIIQKGEPGDVYNICTGTSISMQELLDGLLALSDVDIKVETDPDRLRPSDVMILEGDCSKLKAATGWQPRIPFDRTLKDTLDYWRERV